MADEDQSPAPLTHIPIRRARDKKVHPAEHAYLDVWQEMVVPPLADSSDEIECHEGRLGQILPNIRARLTDRHSRVAASFIMWLGTNCGKSIIRTDLPFYRPRFEHDTCFAAWARDNLRKSYVNGGFRVSDFLTSDDPSKPTVCSDAVEVEIMDHLAAWLDSGEGQQFIARAEARALEYRHNLGSADIEVLRKAYAHA